MPSEVFTFKYYDFCIKKGSIEQTVSWSAGTGDIGPSTFEVEGNVFSLELKKADKFKGSLRDDEVVINKIR